MPLRVAASAIYLPEQCVTSEELDRQHALPAGTVFARTGVASRYYAGSMSAAEMARKALDQALARVGLALTDIDCLIAASGTQEQAIPCNAAKILAQYGGAPAVSAFDVNMTCLSSLMAMDLAASLLACGRYHRIAIVASDVASVGLDWQDVEVGGLFGDGAVALIVEAGAGAGIQASLFRTYPAGVELCQIKGGGSLHHPSRIDGDYTGYGMFRMQGRALFRHTSQVIQPFCAQLLAQAELSLAQIDWVVPHQASGMALQHLVKKFGFDPARVVNLLAERGNQISVSIPSALHTLLHDYPVTEGDRVLLVGTSAGLSLGGLVLQL